MDETFIKKMSEKFKISETCGYNKTCYHRTTPWVPGAGANYKTLAGGSLPSYNFSDYKIRLITGELIMFGGGLGGPWISVDVDGFRNGKDTIGKDVFIMRVFDDALLPLGAKGTFNTKANGENCGCSKDEGAVKGTYIDNIYAQVVSGGCCSAYYLTHDK